MQESVPVQRAVRDLEDFDDLLVSERVDLDEGEIDYGDDDDSEDFDCGLDADGSCSLAGTEECDFECPYNDHK